MKVAVIPKYIQDSDKIAQARPAHREYLSKLLADGKLVLAGAFQDGAGAIIVYEVADLAEGKALAEADPFNTAGVFTSFELHPWKILYSNPAHVASPD